MIKVIDQNPKFEMVLGNRCSKSYELESVKNQFYLGNRIVAFVQRILNVVKLNDFLN